MARQWLTDELWSEIKPLLPPQPPKPKGGRPRADSRACLVGIIFVLRTGYGWNDIPAGTRTERTDLLASLPGLDRDRSLAAAVACRPAAPEQERRY